MAFCIMPAMTDNCPLVFAGQCHTLHASPISPPKPQRECFKRMPNSQAALHASTENKINAPGSYVCHCAHTIAIGRSSELSARTLGVCIMLRRRDDDNTEAPPTFAFAFGIAFERMAAPLLTGGIIVDPALPHGATC